MIPCHLSSKRSHTLSCFRYLCTFAIPERTTDAELNFFFFHRGDHAQVTPVFLYCSPVRSDGYGAYLRFRRNGGSSLNPLAWSTFAGTSGAFVTDHAVDAAEVDVGNCTRAAAWLKANNAVFARMPNPQAVMMQLFARRDPSAAHAPPHGEAAHVAINTAEAGRRICLFPSVATKAAGLTCTMFEPRHDPLRRASCHLFRVARSPFYDPVLVVRHAERRFRFLFRHLLAGPNGTVALHGLRVADYVIRHVLLWLADAATGQPIDVDTTPSLCALIRGEMPDAELEPLARARRRVSSAPLHGRSLL